MKQVCVEWVREADVFMSFVSGELLLVLLSETLTKQTQNSGGIIQNDTWTRCLLCAGRMDGCPALLL